MAVCHVVAIPDELEIVSRLCRCCLLLDLRVLDDDERVGIQVIEVVACLCSGVLGLEELVILPYLGTDALCCRYPVACSLDLPSICRSAALGFRIIGAVNRRDRTIRILLD